MTTERAKLGQPVVDAGSLFQPITPGLDTPRAEDRIAELQARVTALEAELQDARGLLAAGDDPVTTQAQGDRRHERISRRMLQILQLANEEAQQEREEAALHAAAVLERAHAEARALLKAAEATAEELLRAAMLRCEEELGAARAQASQLLESARGQAGRSADAEPHGEQLGREGAPEVQADLSLA